MAQITWNDNGERIYELGCDRGVFYPTAGPGVPWNGILGVAQETEGGSAQPYYQDGIKYMNRAGGEDFRGTLEALTYPDEFAEHDGFPSADGLTFGQQRRKPFHLTYRTLLGNDLVGQDLGYRINLVYNALTEPSTKSFKSLGSSTDPVAMSWGLTTTPIPVPGRRPSAYFSIDSRKLTPTQLEIVEAILYGTENSAPRMPSPVEWVRILGKPVFEIVPNTFSGFWSLDENGLPDVMGTDVDGLYYVPPTTRLVEVEEGLWQFGAPITNFFTTFFEGNF